MISKPNSIKAVIAATGLAVALAMLMAVAQPLGVAASGSQPQAASVIAALETAAARIYHGSAQLAQEMRSLYSVYQLLTSPETISATKSSALLVGDEAPGMVACQDLQQHTREKQDQKRKRRA